MVYVTFDAVFHFFFKNIALDFLSRVSLEVYRSEQEIKFRECLKSLTPISIKYTQGHLLELNHFNQKFSKFLNSSHSLRASSTLNFLFFSSSPIIHGKDFLNNLKSVLCHVYESLNTKCRALWSHRDS